MTKHCRELPALTAAVDSAACLGCWEMQSWQPGRGSSGAPTSCLQLSPRPGRARLVLLGWAGGLGGTLPCSCCSSLLAWAELSCPQPPTGTKQGLSFP